jgi:hypothetical protein
LAKRRGKQTTQGHSTSKVPSCKGRKVLHRVNWVEGGAEQHQEGRKCSGSLEHNVGIETPDTGSPGSFLK